MKPPISTVLLPEAARTAEAIAEIPRDYSSIQVRVKVTDDPATASITPHIEAWDEAAQEWVDLLTGAAITAVGSVVLTVADWATASANVAVDQKAPAKCRFRMAVADTDSMTYSVGAWLHE